MHRHHVATSSTTTSYELGADTTPPVAPRAATTTCCIIAPNGASRTGLPITANQGTTAWPWLTTLARQELGRCIHPRDRAALARWDDATIAISDILPKRTLSTAREPACAPTEIESQPPERRSHRGSSTSHALNAILNAEGSSSGLSRARRGCHSSPHQTHTKHRGTLAPVMERFWPWRRS